MLARIAAALKKTFEKPRSSKGDTGLEDQQSGSDPRTRNTDEGKTEQTPGGLLSAEKGASSGQDDAQSPGGNLSGASGGDGAEAHSQGRGVGAKEQGREGSGRDENPEPAKAAGEDQNQPAQGKNAKQPGSKPQKVSEETASTTRDNKPEESPTKGAKEKPGDGDPKKDQAGSDAEKRAPPERVSAPSSRKTAYPSAGHSYGQDVEEKPVEHPGGSGLENRRKADNRASLSIPENKDLTRRAGQVRLFGNLEFVWIPPGTYRSQPGGPCRGGKKDSPCPGHREDFQGLLDGKVRSNQRTVERCDGKERIKREPCKAFRGLQTRRKSELDRNSGFPPHIGPGPSRPLQIAGRSRVGTCKPRGECCPLLLWR